MYINSSNKINDKDPKFKISDVVRISKYKNFSEEVFMNKKVKNTVPWAYVFSDFKDEDIVETFYKKELRKANQKEFRVQEVIKRKTDKLYVKWKG